MAAKPASSFTGAKEAHQAVPAKRPSMKTAQRCGEEVRRLFFGAFPRSCLDVANQETPHAHCAPT